MLGVAHAHAYGICHSVARLAEARAAARHAEAATAAPGDEDGDAAAQKSEAPPPKLCQMDLRSPSGVPWGVVSLGADNCVTRLDNPSFEEMAPAFFFDVEKVKAQGPIAGGWLGLGPSATKFGMMGILPAILRPEPDNMAIWDRMNAKKKTDEDD